MQKLILNEKNLCHDDLGKKRMKYAAMDVATKREMLDLEKVKCAAMDIGRKERSLKIKICCHRCRWKKGDAGSAKYKIYYHGYRQKREMPEQNQAKQKAKYVAMDICNKH